MTPVRSWGSTNGCLHASEALRSVLVGAGVRRGRDAGVVAEHKAERLVCNYYGDAPTEVARPPHTLRNTPRASATTTRLCPADQHPRPCVFNHLPAASKHAPPSQASSSAAASYSARAGRTPLAGPKSLPLDTCDTENCVTTLVEAIPYTYMTAALVTIVTAHLQPTQQQRKHAI